MLGQQAEELSAAAAPHRVDEERALVRVGARLEQEPYVLEVRVVERVRERVRAARLGAVPEQEAQALGALGLDRVVERVAEARLRVRIGPGLEEHARQLRVVEDAGRAVERGHRSVLVGEKRVRVRAEAQELPREVDGREARMADVVERCPGARAADLVRVAVPAAAEHEERPAVALDLQPHPEHGLGPVAAAGRRRDDEALGVAHGA